MSGGLPSSTNSPFSPAVVVLACWKVVVLLYDVVTLPVFLFLEKPWRRLRLSITPKSKLSDPSDPYSSYERTFSDAPSNLDIILSESDNISDVFRRTMKYFGKKPCFGVRKLLGQEDVKQPSGKIFQKLILEDHYTWTSYDQANELLDNLSAGLFNRGVRPGDRVVLWAESRPEWALSMHAVFRIGASVVTIYNTLGEDGVIHAINETEVTHIITSFDLLSKMTKIIAKCPKVKTIVYLDSPTSKKGTPPQALTERVSCFSYSFVLTDGESLKGESLPFSSPKLDEMAIMMYTSGSTGTPKGVMISHKNMLFTMRSVLKTLPGNFHRSLDPDHDIFFAYLPQAHIFEMTCEMSIMASGVPSAFGSPLTMLDNSTAIRKGDKGDLNVVRPTLMPCVPLILDRIRKAVVDKVDGRNNRLLKGLFEFALDYKTYWTRRGYSTPLINKFIFSKIKQMMGGRMEMLLVGGAPLSPESQEFASNCLDCHILQGYAATECSATGTLMDINDLSFGRVGGPFADVKIRLIDWREGSYYATDKPNPRGEILIGGDSIAMGYFKREEETSQCFFQEGGTRWWATGDIGEMAPDGSLKIIDRKKDLVKLQHGEYISLGKVEAALGFCEYVDNICVFGNSFHTNVISLIVPNRRALTALGNSLGKSSSSFNDLCKDSEVVSAVRKSISDWGTKMGLMRTEIPTEVFLCTEEWHPDNGMVTASLKVRRKQIEEHYKQDIIRMFGNSEGTSKST